MGVEIAVDLTAVDWPALLAKLAPATVVMVDGALVMPNAPVPDGWRDVRVKTTAGTFAIKRTASGAAVVAFGNADEATRAMQQRIADALG